MNKYIKEKGFYRIILNGKRGGEALVDLMDYEKVKDISWSKNTLGYVTGSKDYRYVYLHRYILRVPEDKRADHINHDTLDNRRSNLRIVTTSQNNMNKKKQSNNTSDIVGVSYVAKEWFGKDKNGNDLFRSPHWRANININGKRISLGRFKKKEDAIAARKKAEDKYFGEYKYIPS